MDKEKTTIPKNDNSINGNGNPFPNDAGNPFEEKSGNPFEEDSEDDQPPGNPFESSLNDSHDSIDAFDKIENSSEKKIQIQFLEKEIRKLKNKKQFDEASIVEQVLREITQD